jgi:hypothetical protein
VPPTPEIYVGVVESEQVMIGVVPVAYGIALKVAVMVYGPPLGARAPDVTYTEGASVHGIDMVTSDASTALARLVPRRGHPGGVRLVFQNEMTLVSPDTKDDKLTDVSIRDAIFVSYTGVVKG